MKKWSESDQSSPTALNIRTQKKQRQEQHGRDSIRGEFCFNSGEYGGFS